MKANRCAYQFWRQTKLKRLLRKCLGLIQILVFKLVLGYSISDLTN